MFENGSAGKREKSPVSNAGVHTVSMPELLPRFVSAHNHAAYQNSETCRRPLKDQFWLSPYSIEGTG